MLPPEEEKKQRQQDDGREVGDARRRQRGLPHLAVDLAGVLEHRHDQAERGGGQRNRQQQRLRHPPERGEGRTGAVGQDQRHQVAEHGEAEQSSPQVVHVDLQPGQEEQERQAEQGQDRHRQVDVNPAEPGRPDDDAADDLQHDRRDAQPWQVAHDERGEDGDGGDHEQIGEGYVRHGCSAPG